jgi:2-polyprenyl-6-methoxyphenol hydroxylase-like FAD-dependent oxidoreductase
MKTALIQGAGITGTALAWWLNQYGWTTTLVERSPELRSGGQAIDVRGAALLVAERMGLLSDIEARRTRFRGMSVFDEDGREVERIRGRTLGNRREDGDVELFRDDLFQLLHTGLGKATTYLFSDEIVAIQEDKGGVDVTLSSGREMRADIVVGADGVNSGLRRLAFGTDESFMHHLGFYAGTYAAPNAINLEDWQLVFRTPKRGVIVYPTRDNSQLRVGLYFASSNPNPAAQKATGQRQLFKEHCGDIGGPFAALVQAIDQADDLYASPMAQVRMESWSSGRIVLAGDASFCPTPLTGQGTSLALVGAYVLAEELAREGEISDGFMRYEQRLRGFVALNQDIDPSTGSGTDLAKNAIDLQLPIK